MKKLVIQISGFIISLVLSFVVLDKFIALTYISNVSYNDVYEDIGRGRRAGLNFVSFNEGFSIGQFNKYRYLGPSYPPSKENGTIRIALLGDSYVEGFQVFDRNHFRNLLEAELSIKLGQKVEVMNFGRSGFDIGDMYCYNQTLVSEFNPDFSLYFISKGDLSPKFTDPLRMKLRLTGDSLIVYKGYPEEYIRVFNRTKKLIQYSTIFNMLNNCKKLTISEGVWPILLDKFYLVRSTNAQMQENSKKEFNLPIITERILDEMKPSSDIIINRDIDGMEVLFEEAIAENGLTYINLSDTLQSMKDSGIDPNYWKATKKNGHWNQEGHKAVANYIVKELLERSIIE
jgi:hypothetical protein